MPPIRSFPNIGDTSQNQPCVPQYLWVPVVPSDELQRKKELEPGETFTEGLYYSMCEIAKNLLVTCFLLLHPAFDLHGPSLNYVLVTSCK